MQNVPDVKYARSGGVAVAYQVIGEGPRDLMFVTFLSNLVSLWQFSPMRRFFEQLAAETRLIVVNPRGMGLSDRPRSVTLEGWMDDIRAVLDAERMERASLLGYVDSANACLLLATTYPEQVERLVLYTPIARFVRSDEYPIGVPEEDAQATIRSRREHWGDRDYLLELAARLNPQWADDEEYLDWFVLNARLAMSPTAAAEFWRMQMNTDITDVLSSVRVPTLVLHRAAWRDEAQFVAQRIAGAIVIEIPGVGLTIADDAIVDATLAFVRGESPRFVPDTVLATVLFTDLVGSTATAAALGDRAWREVLERHHAAVRREVARFRGSVVDTAGDGFFCRFDGPARAIACAREIVAAAPELGLAVRAGLHTGECELALEKLVGLSVVIGARVAAEAAAGEVLVTGTVKDLVAGSGLTFEDRGERTLKGVPGSWHLYTVTAE
ncbi:MAG: adenylate/guanylate cyclase domain-containing protein [Gaiellaceae bacterium]